MSDTLSFLTHSKLPLAKTWRADGTIEDYSKPKNFKLEKITVNDIHNLSAILSVMEKRPRTCLIRGVYTGDSPNQTMRRKEVFSDQSLHTILIEIDKHAPKNIDPNLEPVKAIDSYIVSNLPEAFHEVSYHWQLSNSAGHESKAGILKAHVYFWLSTSYTSAQLRAWAQNNNLTSVLDIATLDTVQVHYTSAPIFDPSIKDPVPVRSGFVSGIIGDEVDLILDSDSLNAKARERPTGESFYSGQDDTALWLDTHGLVKGSTPEGKIFLDCPFAENHTEGKISDTDTTYLPPGLGGYEQGHFRCLHSSCRDRSDSDFLDAFGIRAEDFDVIIENSTADKTTSRFTPVQAADYATLYDPEWLIDDIIPEAELGLIFGASGSRKTFVAIDLAVSITAGLPWNSKNTKPGPVLYICAEGANDFRIRLRAYARNFGIDLKNIPLHIIGDTPNLLLEEDVKELINSVKHLGPFSAIFIDTLAQTTAGADENSGKDMMRALSNCKAIHKALSGIVIAVHHAGKDLTKGARGWSGLKAAADFEIEMTDNLDGTSTLRISKQKGGEMGQMWRVTTLPIDLGTSARGKNLRSLVVQYQAKSLNSGPVKFKKRNLYEQEIDKIFDDGGAQLWDYVVNAVAAAIPGNDQMRKKKHKAKTVLENMLASGELEHEGNVIRKPL